MKTASSGFTLVEVLVAMIVLAIGVLGVAGLQATGLRSSYSASLRSQATMLAYEMTDRLRANLAGYRDNDYNNTIGVDSYCVWHGHTTAVCSPRQMAQHDVFEWRQTLAEELPQGVGVVCLDSTPNDGGDMDSNGTVDPAEFACDNTGDLYAVKLWWVDDIRVDAGGTPIFQRFATGFHP